MNELMTTDFISSYRRGQERAETAKNSRQEVFTIIEEAASQLKNETGDRLQLDLFERDSLGVQLGELLSSFQRYIGPRQPIREKELAFVIGASNPTAKTLPVFMAGLQFSSQGYPCTLSWLKTVRMCENRVEFEDSVKSMLEDPIIGEELRKIIAAQPKENEPESEKKPEAVNNDGDSD